MTARRKTVASPALVDSIYVAKYLEVTVETVERACRRKELPAVKFGRRWYIRKDRLEQMFDVVRQEAS